MKGSFALIAGTFTALGFQVTIATKKRNVGDKQNVSMAIQAQEDAYHETENLDSHTRYVWYNRMTDAAAQLDGINYDIDRIMEGSGWDSQEKNPETNSYGGTHIKQNGTLGGSVEEKYASFVKAKADYVPFWKYDILDKDFAPDPLHLCALGFKITAQAAFRMCVVFGASISYGNDAPTGTAWIRNPSGEIWQSIPSEGRTIRIYYNYTGGDLPHKPADPVPENIAAATCTEEGGYDEVVHCRICAKPLSSKHVVEEKLPHTPSDPVRENTVEPTCTAEGSYDEVVYCSACHEELSRTTKTVAKKPHTAGNPVSENAVEAKCTEDGSHDEVVYCAACGAEMSRTKKTDPQKGYDMHTTEVEAEPIIEDGRCVGWKPGATVTACSRCDEQTAVIHPVETRPAMDIDGWTYRDGTLSVTCNVTDRWKGATVAGYLAGAGFRGYAGNPDDITCFTVGGTFAADEGGGTVISDHPDETLSVPVTFTPDDTETYAPCSFTLAIIVTADACPYVDENGSPMEATRYSGIGEMPTDGTASGWYAVTENRTISGRLIINGDVNLILCDGKEDGYICTRCGDAAVFNVILKWHTSEDQTAAMMYEVNRGEKFNLGRDIPGFGDLVFRGWNIYENKTIDDVDSYLQAEGMTIYPTDTAYTVTCDILVQAVFGILCTVAFDPGKGTGTMADEHGYEGDAFILPGCTFGHDADTEFAGWTVNGGDEVIPAGEEVTLTGDTKLTAIWKYAFGEADMSMPAGIAEVAGHAGDVGVDPGQLRIRGRSCLPQLHKADPDPYPEGLRDGRGRAGRLRSRDDRRPGRRQGGILGPELDRNPSGVRVPRGVTGRCPYIRNAERQNPPGQFRAGSSANGPRRCHQVSSGRSSRETVAWSNRFHPVHKTRVFP